MRWRSVYSEHIWNTTSIVSSTVDQLSQHASQMFPFIQHTTKWNHHVSFTKTDVHVFKHWNQREISIISALPQLLSSTSFCQTTIQGMSPWPPNLPEKPCCLLTPPPTVVLSPASCSLGLVVVVSVLVELCDVGGKRGWGGGSSVECCSSRGGDGLKVILVRFTTQTQQKKTKQL